MNSFIHYMGFVIAVTGVSKSWDYPISEWQFWALTIMAAIGLVTYEAVRPS